MVGDYHTEGVHTGVQIVVQSVARKDSGSGCTHRYNGAVALRLPMKNMNEELCSRF